MAAPKFKKNNVEQTINLKDAFGVSFKGKRALREALGQAIIDRIVDRSQNGVGMSFGKSGRGTPVKLKSPYSDEYAKSDEFQAAGKSKNKINMTLTGDMLGLMDVKRQTSETITIGWNESDENPKAFNHSVGDTVPRRPFFGVNKAELKDIGREFSRDIKRIVDETNRNERDSLILALIDRIQGDGDG